MYQVKILYHRPVTPQDYKIHLGLPGVGVLAENALGVMLDQAQGDVGSKPITQGVSLIYADKETWERVVANPDVQAALADAQRLAGGPDGLSVLAGEVEILKAPVAA